MLRKFKGYCLQTLANSSHQLRGLCANKTGRREQRTQAVQDVNCLRLLQAWDRGEPVPGSCNCSPWGVSAQRSRGDTCCMKRGRTRALCPKAATVEDRFCCSLALLFSLRYRASPLHASWCPHCLLRRPACASHAISTHVQSGLVFPHPGLSSSQPLDYSRSLPDQLLLGESLLHLSFCHN